MNFKSTKPLSYFDDMCGQRFLCYELFCTLPYLWLGTVCL